MKKLLVFLAVTGMLLVSCNKQNGQPEWQKKYNDPKQVRELFANPPMFYAPHTFWFWDDTIRDEKFAATMAAEMCKQGLNPGYAHPRSSQDPNNPLYPSLPKNQYLSDIWFNSFNNALHEAENAGMTLGYCDEYDWPSGQAAGRVLEKHPELEAQFLKWERKVVKGPKEIDLPSSKFTVAAKLIQNKIDAQSLQIIGDTAAFKWAAPAGEWVVYSYVLDHHPGHDGGKVNYLDPKLMDIFIPIVHEQYEKYCGAKMGKSIPGVFVDNEGDYGWQMAWSDYLPEKYKQMKNRDMRLWLPLLTEKDKDGIYAKARYDWFDVVSELYLHNYLSPMVDWLKKRNMYYISNLWEETIVFQTVALGDFMAAQRIATMPGTDCLEMRSQDVHDFKETQTVCEFEDRPMMSEIMGVAGWYQTPAQMKMTINSVTAFGVTHVVPHGIYVNRKFGTHAYPADWFTENPYWNYLHLWTDFARRSAFVNRQGHLVADVLLVKPMESIWAQAEKCFSNEYTNSWDPMVFDAEYTYGNAMREMTKNNIEHLIGDKYYLEKAVVEKNDLGKTNISVNGYKFNSMVLPTMVVMHRKSAEKILEFAEKGGLVVLLGKLPQGSPEEGENDQTVADMMKKLSSLPNVVRAANEKASVEERLKSMISILKEKADLQIKVAGADLPLYTAHRKIGNNDFYWIANNNSQIVNCTLKLRDGAGSAEKWNCENGAITPVSYVKTESVNEVKMSITPYEGFWLTFNPDAQAAPAIPESEGQEILMSGQWNISLSEKDTVSVTSALVMKTEDVDINKAIMAKEFMLDSNWKYTPFVVNEKSKYRWNSPMAVFEKEGADMHYRYSFEMAELPKQCVINVCGDDDERIWINGTSVPVSPRAASYNTTAAYDITSYLHKGSNTISICIINTQGLGTLMFEGWYELQNGNIGSIVINKSWKQSLAKQNNWEMPEFNDKAWAPVNIAPEGITIARQSESECPVNMKSNVVKSDIRKLVYWRMPVPVGASKMMFEEKFKNAQLFLDGNKVDLKGNEIAIPQTSQTIIFVWNNTSSENYLIQPIRFVCDQSQNRKLESWYNYGLHQYTGFVDYENTINVEETSKKVSLDLGSVKYMAEVWINGKSAGKRLWDPFLYDISGLINKGKNTIKVRVGNLVLNKIWMMDDLGQLRTWSWSGKPDLMKYQAGLYGPVKIKIQK